ncbi:MAG: hypothetical protein IPL96_11465 [Holophagaceae bacterium]|nr:hypothetical protein [Holophagaceae bacterium]
MPPGPRPREQPRRRPVTGELRRAAQKLAKRHKLHIEVLDVPALEGQFRLRARRGGRARPGRPGRSSFTPKEKAKRHIVLVGKGVCFDSGYSIRDAAGMGP